MCPVCLTTAALIAGSVLSLTATTGGLAAIAIKKLGGKNIVDNKPDSTGFNENQKT